MKQLLIPGNIKLLTLDEFSIDIINEVQSKCILLLMSEKSKKRYSLDCFMDILEKNTVLIWISEISPNPTVIDLYNLLKSCYMKSFDCVIAIGGGSTIDLAKSYVALSYLNDKVDLLSSHVINAIQFKEYSNQKINIPIIAVPTTAGTGSEVTQWATIWDMENKLKYSIDNERLYPFRVYLVTKLSCSMSRKLSLSTGLDALCHAVEAYWAKSTSIFAKELSKTAISLIIEYLPKVLLDETNLIYREKMLIASLFAGLSFSHTRTTACHSISYPLTIMFGIEHGIACAMCLPHILDFNFSLISEREELLRVLKIRNSSELIKWINQLSKDIIPLHLSSYGVREEDIDEIATKSFTNGRIDNNPVFICIDDVKRILKLIL